VGAIYLWFVISDSSIHSCSTKVWEGPEKRNP
jgi:hypothetical protein